jgi:RNA polymerase sigma-70 factor (ECF subfamily)
MTRSTTSIIDVPARRAVGLEAAAFDGIVRAHQRRLYRLLLAMTRNPDEADSLTQETFVRAFEHRDAFRGDCAVGTWLTRIAINLVRDRTRSSLWRFWQSLFRRDGDAAAEAEQVPDDAPDPARALLAREDARAIGEAVARLSVRQRAAFTLRYLEEQSVAQIAETLGCEVGTVKSHLARAVASIRREVGHERS